MTEPPVGAATWASGSQDGEEAEPAEGALVFQHQVDHEQEQGGCNQDDLG